MVCAHRENGDKEAELRIILSVMLLMVALVAPAHADRGATLKGSRASMVRQHRIAKEHEFAFLRTPGQVAAHAERGELVPVEGNEDYVVLATYRYAREELRTFVERLAARYRQATGEPLVVTSLVRPASRQPSNAHALSVHPAGMALDLRVPRDAEARGWLERSLLSLEGEGVLDATRERRPPHYHVALFPQPYMAYVQEKAALRAVAAEAPAVPEALRPVPGLEGAEPPAHRASAAGAERSGRLAGRLSLIGALLSLLALGLGRLRRRGRPAEPARAGRRTSP